MEDYADDINIDRSSLTDPENTRNEESRKFLPEIGDDDGENRKPEIRANIISTGFLIAKAMIGAGILNTPLIFKTFGLIYGTLTTILFGSISIFTLYLLLKCKDITQRYSYSVYSKIILGRKGTIINKGSLIVMTFALCCVYIIVLGAIIKSLIELLVKFQDDSFFSSSKFYSVVVALLLMFFMFQNDISGVAKFSFLGIISLLILFFCTLCLFINKFINNQIKPLESQMLKVNGNIAQLFECFGGYYNSYVFHFSIFPIYLPLKPRNTKSMVKAGFYGVLIGGFLYWSFGILCFIIYRYDINDSILLLFAKDLLEFKSKKNILMLFVLFIFEIAFLINVSISLLLIFFMSKQNLIGLITFIWKSKKNKEEIDEGIPLEDIDKEGNVLDDNEKKIDLLSDKVKNIITLFFYIFVLLIAISSKTIIALDNFNGSTVSNYISLISPAVFYLYFYKKSQFNTIKLFAIFVIILGFALIICYFINLFMK